MSLFLNLRMLVFRFSGLCVFVLLEVCGDVYSEVTNSDHSFVFAFVCSLQCPYKWQLAILHVDSLLLHDDNINFYTCSTQVVVDFPFRFLKTEFVFF